MISWQQNRGGGSDGKGTPDADLVRAARRGDKRAFVEIVARHQAMVCGVALGILGDFAASEDAAQEAFLTAWRKIHDLREPEKLRAWLGQIARHAALGNLRRKRGHDSLDEAATLADESPSPDEVTASEEEAALVRDSLSKLPESYRLPLVLFYRDGQSVRAVAETLAISEDAVKQRLARGREMLREQMSGLVESVLTRTAPTTVFTMTIAAAIGALATPAAVAGAVFTATSTAAATTTSSLSSQILTAMSTTKTSIITAALVAAVCVPVGYHVATDRSHADHAPAMSQIGSTGTTTESKTPPSFESSAIFAEWRKLHEVHGTTAESMPAIYDAIAALRDPFHRRAFRAALIAEWVQLDAAGGFQFFLGQRDATQRRQFFQEWLARDAATAVDGLMASGSGWEQIARDSLVDIARKVPARVPQIVEQLPASTSYWDTRVRDAFVIVAEKDLKSARTAAEALRGTNREQALGGVAQGWAKSDMNAAMAWVKALPEGTDRDELIRAALFGKAAVDPASALDQIGIVPPGGRQSYFATTTGARVLKEAANADYDATVAWIAAHPGRLGHDDMMGIANAVTERLNADPIAFLNRHAADNSLVAIMPAINSALLNEGGGQRAVIWEWLKTQPEGEVAWDLRQRIISAAGYQDTALALRLAGDLPQTKEGDEQIQTLASSLFNGGSMLHRFDKLFEQAPERLRQPLLENAFNYLREDTLNDPQAWLARLNFLPEESRMRGVNSIATAWAAQNPEETVGWIKTLAAGKMRDAAVESAVSGWAQKDVRGVGEWVSTFPSGQERDRGAGMIALAVAQKEPREAMNWITTIGDESERARMVAQASQLIAARDLNEAKQWIETAPISSEEKARFQGFIDQRRPTVPPQN